MREGNFCDQPLLERHSSIMRSEFRSDRTARMKKSVLLSFLAFVCLFSAGAYSSTVVQFQSNGVVARTTACTNNCNGEALVTLLQDQGGGHNTYFVYFDVYGTDSQGQLTDINAVGQIPPSMVSGNGNTNLTLTLDTNAAGLQVNYCVADQFYNWTCSPYSGGVMSITWQTTKQYSSSGTGQQTMTFPNFTARTNFNSTTSSAVVQANIFGTVYADAGYSELGSGHNGGLTITKP